MAHTYGRKHIDLDARGFVKGFSLAELYALGTLCVDTKHSLSGACFRFKKAPLSQADVEEVFRPLRSDFPSIDEVIPFDRISSELVRAYSREEAQKLSKAVDKHTKAKSHGRVARKQEKLADPLFWKKPEVFSECNATLDAIQKAADERIEQGPWDRLEKAEKYLQVNSDPPPFYVPEGVRVSVAFGVCGEGRGTAEPRAAHPCPSTTDGHDAANAAGVIQFKLLCGR
jgi:hypothetical protein